MKNRTILGIICVVLAVVVMFGVAPFVAKMSAGKITVIQVNKVIAQGRAITPDDIVKVDIGRQGVADSVIKDEKQLVGKFAKTDIYNQTNITEAMVSNTADSADDILKSLDGSKQAISITVPSFASALSSKLKNGDIISVIVTEDKATKIPAELTYVKVITTTTASGTDQDKVAPNEDGTVDLPSTVTLLVNATQAKLLANYEANAKMHLELVYRGDSSATNKFLETQDKIFTTGGN